jgi:hypothetical protein
MIASQYDVIWLNLDNSKEIDIDNEFNICEIKKIYYHDHKFYILTNKSQKKIGFYLIEFDEKDPLKVPPRYIINQTG